MKIVTLNVLERFKNKIKNMILDTLPIGSIVEYSGTTVPNGWAEVADDPEIIENENGTAFKYSNGYLVCCYIITMTNKNTTYHYQSATWVPPIAFNREKMEPVVLVTPVNWNTQSTTCKAKFDASSNISIMMQWMSHTGGALIDKEDYGIANIFAIGRWK